VNLILPRRSLSPLSLDREADRMRELVAVDLPLEEVVLSP